MGYSGKYSLGKRSLSEFVGTAMLIYFGESVLANELLPNTKGHAMGWGWVSFGFAFAFFPAIQIFDRISAHLNPAMCAALWTIGQLQAQDFFALAAVEFGGAFLGNYTYEHLCLAEYSLRSSKRGVCVTCVRVCSEDMCASKFTLRRHSGASLVWIHYLPHFKTIPEPPPENKDDGFLRRRDYQQENAVNLASYDNRKLHVRCSTALCSVN